MAVQIDLNTNDLDFDTASKTHRVARALRALAQAVRAAPHIKSPALDPTRLCEHADALDASFVVTPLSDEDKQTIFENIQEQLADLSTNEQAREYVSEWDEFDWVSEMRDMREAEDES